MQIHTVVEHSISDSDGMAALGLTLNPVHQENPKLDDPSMFVVEWTVGGTLAWSHCRKCGVDDKAGALVYGLQLFGVVLDPTKAPTLVDMSVSSPASRIVRHVSWPGVEWTYPWA